MKDNIENGVNEDTELRILRAAEQEFMLKGFVGARTKTIAEAAGVTHAMLHYYFRTKEKLFHRIVGEKIELLKEVIMKSLLNLDRPLNEIVKGLIGSHLDFINANPMLPGFIVREVFSDPERASVFLDRLRLYAAPVVAALQNKLDDEVEAGKCRRADVMSLLLDIVSLNVFPFMAQPAINAALDGMMENSDEFLERRKKENYETILRKLDIKENDER